MTKLKSLKVKEETYKNLLLAKSRKQLELERCVPYDEIIQNFLHEGTVNLDIPKNMAERLKKEIKKRYDTDSLEQGIQKILEDWVKERKGK